MNAPTPSRRRARGFSLVEVLVAVVILSVGLIGLVGLQARAVQFSVSAEDTNRAALLASDLAASMWTARSVALPNATIATWQARVADPTVDGLPNGIGTVSVNGSVATITITWVPPNAAAGSQPNQYVTQVVLS